ncbi:MAG: hypothetical protein IT306_20295 [Chloroflexi bacterium]|nr:hypothetical protein [Chloroflexota bacterium]
MSLSERSSTSYPDELTPETMRRFQLWRAISDLAKAQEDGRLSADQARLLESLADTLQRLSAQLSAVADLGRQYLDVLEPLTQQPQQQPETRTRPHEHDASSG